MANARPTSSISVPAGNELSRYLREIRAFPMLSRKEEQDLARRWRDDGDEQAAEKLVASHLRLVVKIARGASGYGQPLADLISEGTVGLMQAVKQFDPDREVRFGTYATWWIRAAIYEYVMRSARLVRVGTTAAQKKLFFNLSRMKAAHNELSAGGLSPEGAKSIAEALGVSTEDVIDMDRRMTGADQSLNATLRDEGEDTWQDFLVDEGPDQETLVADAEELDQRRTLMRRAMRRLSRRERDILTQRRLKEDRKTLQDLSEVYGVSRERIRQIEARALDKLRAEMMLAVA